MQISQVTSFFIDRIAAHSVRWRMFTTNEAGATAVEYGLIVGGISVAIVAVVFNLGEDLDNLFQSLANDFRSKTK